MIVILISIELILLASHDPDELAKQLKKHLGRPATHRHGHLFRVRCHNMIEAEELAHRLPQVLGVSAGIADWENAKLTGDDDVRNAFMEALRVPQAVEAGIADVAHLPESDPATIVADLDEIDKVLSEAKQEPPADYPVIHLVAPVPPTDADQADGAVQ